MEILYLSWMLHTGQPSTVFLFLWLSWEPMWNMSFQSQSLWLRWWDVRKYQRGFSHSKILEPRLVSSHWTHHAGLQWGRNQRCQGRVWICQSPPLCLLQRTSLGEMGEKWYWLLIFTVNQFSFKEFFNCITSCTKKFHVRKTIQKQKENKSCILNKNWFINPQQNWIKSLCNVSEKNIPHIDKDELLSTLRNVAYSTTIEEYELAEESLRSCHWFKHPVKNYIEHKWLSVKEVSRIIFENTI